MAAEQAGDLAAAVAIVALVCVSDPLALPLSCLSSESICSNARGDLHSDDVFREGRKEEDATGSMLSPPVGFVVLLPQHRAVS